jgi:hypothetical protein
MRASSSQLATIYPNLPFKDGLVYAGISITAALTKDNGININI